MRARLRGLRFLIPWALAVPALLPGQAAAQVQLQKLVATGGYVGDYFAGSVSVCGSRAIVGAYCDDGAEVNAGTAYIFDTATGQQLVELDRSGVSTNEGFGWSVGISGDRAVVGAWGRSAPMLNAGAAYIHDVTTGLQLFRVIPTDSQVNQEFGSSVAIDGDLAVVGADGDLANGPWSGAVYVIDVPTGQILRKIVPADGAAYDSFGWSVALSGTRAVIGAYYDSDSGWLAGSAYVYDVTNGQQLHKLLASDGEPDDWFGYTVAVDGDLAVIGAYRNDDNGVDSGSAYVFDLTTGQELHKLLASDGSAGDSFGRSVAIRGNRVVVGAPIDTDLAVHSGSAYVYDAASGEELFKLRAVDARIQSGLGLSVAAWGELALAGAPYARVLDIDAGAVYAFDLVGAGSGYCFGDPGSGTPCPCGNDNDGSVSGSGCANGVYASGAQLLGGGDASVSADSLILAATGVEPNRAGLFFQANQRVNAGNGNPFGDGLRCAGGGVVRLQVVNSNWHGIARTTIPLAARGGVGAWDIRYYQYWYRTIMSPPCGLGVNDFNLSSGYELMWLP